MIPLAEKLRPASILEIVGQKHLIGKQSPIRRMLEKEALMSMILWGPPGCGKTTIAKLIANESKSHFISLSAVNSGKADVMKVVAQAKEIKQAIGKQTILFIDEIHRFNKAQQDAFLPYVEDGTITLIGATTENPSFSVISPLLSRSRIFKLNSLSDEDIKEIVEKAVKFYPKNTWEKDALELIVKFSNGDARTSINAVELSATLAKKITLKVAQEALQKKSLYYDKKGESHFDTISAFIKSMRGCDANATLHYLARMIKAGEDPMFIARRMVIFASEDIGNARPNALVLAVTCMDAVKMIGMPESSLILSQTATYLASCPKSIASTSGLYAALADIDIENLEQIPLHLRNAPNKYMESLGYGKGHTRYAWKVEKETGKKVNQQYLPDKLKDRKYYNPDW
jgi:putative ATPase